MEGAKSCTTEQGKNSELAWCVSFVCFEGEVGDAAAVDVSSQPQAASAQSPDKQQKTPDFAFL